MLRNRAPLCAGKAQRLGHGIDLCATSRLQEFLGSHEKCSQVFEMIDHFWFLSGLAKMYHFFHLERDTFLSHYHKRSNVESTFSMIKRKFGDSHPQQERRGDGQRSLGQNRLSQPLRVDPGDLRAWHQHDVLERTGTAGGRIAANPTAATMKTATS
jgi:hypothetical protein